MPKVFFHPDGRPTPHPTDRQDARRRRRLRYDDDQLCPRCHDCRIKFTHNGRCIHCARLAALEFYNTCDPSIPRNVVYAVRDRAACYVVPEACGKAGHVGLRTLEGECWECREEMKQPQRRPSSIHDMIRALPADTTLSRAEAQQWHLPAYRTGKPCRNGHRSWRYTSTGACMVCLGRLDKTGA